MHGRVHAAMVFTRHHRKGGREESVRQDECSTRKGGSTVDQSIRTSDPCLPRSRGWKAEAARGQADYDVFPPCCSRKKKS
jgi:hypothetical protein